MSKKSSATSGIRQRMEALREMAARGTEHEAAVAKSKLAKLEASFHFKDSADGEKVSLFEGIHVTRMENSHSISVITINHEESEIGSYVKWAFQDGLSLDSFWKKLNTGPSELQVFASKTDLPQLRDLATHIHKSFRAAWMEYTAKGTINSTKRAPFLSGLYDGMMGANRNEGIRVPQALNPRKKRRKGPRVKNAPPPSVDIHPYELGISLGRHIAMKVAPRALTAELRRILQSGSEPES